MASKSKLPKHDLAPAAFVDRLRWLMYQARTLGHGEGTGETPFPEVWAIHEIIRLRAEVRRLRRLGGK